MTSIALTGHRVEKLVNIDGIKKWLTFALDKIRPEEIICGMASGFDLIGGVIALDLGIPVIAARPWATHGPRVSDKDSYDRIIQEAQEIVNISMSPVYVGPWMYGDRNQYMVDRSHKGIACWNREESGGTWDCIKRYKKAHKNVMVFNPNTGEAIPMINIREVKNV